MKSPLPLIALVALFLTLCVLYNLMTPLGEGPDEPGHAAYVFFLAREGRLPVQCPPPCVSDVPGSGHHPPLAYLLATPATLWLPQSERTFDLPGNPRFTWAGGDQVNAVAHGSREQWPWDAQVWAWRLARGVSSLAGAATVIFTYLVVRCRADDAVTGDRVALLAAALVAFNPQFIFISSLISNDALLAALGAVLLWLVVSSPRSLPRAMLIGVVLGLALITKQSALIFVPLALVWCVTGEKRLGVAASAGGAAIVVAGAALVSSWWYLRNWRLYGDPLGLQAFRAEFATQAFEAINPAAWAGALITLYESFWVRFGWMNLPAPAWAMSVYAALLAAAVAGWVRILVRPNKAMHRRSWQLVALPFLTLAWVVSFAFTAGLVAWQGRLLFPAIAAIAALLACGLSVWLRRHLSVMALIIGMAGIAAWLSVGVIGPAYPVQTLSVAAARAWEGHETYVRFARSTEPGAVIRRWRIEGTPRPGATIELMLLWNALSRQDRDWWTFVHLVDVDRRIVTEDNREPRDGAYPMSQWVAGDWVEARYTLAIPADLPPGDYALWVGLWDPTSGRRAAFFDDDDVYDPDSDHVVLTILNISGQ
ncbi:glycosyltransferase family 39 protein [Roseiflexus sp.]|uniref:glycosyltransferase family 39 protein n=1 Tax=Roseiflexus sp. TaxID=2562120 RepID=UPI00398B93D2